MANDLWRGEYRLQLLGKNVLILAKTARDQDRLRHGAEIPVGLGEQGSLRRGPDVFRQHGGAYGDYIDYAHMMFHKTPRPGPLSPSVLLSVHF